jgi:hypothetical protein
MSMAGERITFIVTRGVIALALVGAGMFCIAKGIGFWAIPRAESSQLGVELGPFHLTGGGLGGVIFGAGIAICYIAYKSAPKGLESSTTREVRGTPSGNSGPPPSGGGPGALSATAPAELPGVGSFVPERQPVVASVTEVSKVYSQPHVGHEPIVFSTPAHPPDPFKKG